MTALIVRLATAGSFLFLVSCGASAHSVGEAGDGGASTLDIANADGGVVDGSAADRPCGLDGDVPTRVASCGARRCIAAATKALVSCEGQHDFTWSLVSRVEARQEVWRDEQTGALWSGDVIMGVNQAGAFDGCAHPSDLELQQRGGLTVPFHLPTMDDYRSADTRGLLAAVTGMADTLWWTADSFDATDAWAYLNGTFKRLPKQASDEYFRYRCITAAQ